MRTEVAREKRALWTPRHLEVTPCLSSQVVEEPWEGCLHNTWKPSRAGSRARSWPQMLRGALALAGQAFLSAGRAATLPPGPGRQAHLAHR